MYQQKNTNKDVPLVFYFAFSLSTSMTNPSLRRWDVVRGPWKLSNSPGGMNEPWSKLCCLVSTHNAVTSGSDAFTNEDGLRMMTQVEFNSLFCQKRKELREKDASQALEVNSIYNKAHRRGFDLLSCGVVTYLVPAYPNLGGSSHSYSIYTGKELHATGWDLCAS